MAQGFAGQGYATSAVDVPQQIPDLQRISDRLSNYIASIRHQNDTLSNIISRVYGEGEPTGKELARPQAAGVVGAFNRQLDDFEDAINRNNALIMRLCQLA